MIFSFVFWCPLSANWSLTKENVTPLGKFRLVENGLEARWYEEGEKNTKYFLSLEKGNKSKSCIRKLIIDDSVEITDQAALRKEIKTFYENLYTKKSMKTEQQCFEYLEKISTPQLSENDKAICEDKLTLQNIWEALNSMKNGKTPGNDGLTKDFMFFVVFFFWKRWSHYF